MGNLGEGILDDMFHTACNAFFDQIKSLFSYFSASPEVIKSFTFVDILYEKLQVIALALLILIVAFQSFKCMFAYLGFECDEPWRIGGKAIVFGFLIGYAKDIALVALGLSNNFINYLWGAYSSKTIIADLVQTTIDPTTPFFSWNAIFFIYLCVKFIKLAFRFGERLTLTAILIMASPLAFSAGVSQTTKGFFQGWVKLFTGNLVVQILQVAIFIAIVLFKAQNPLLTNFFSFIVIISLIKIFEKLEEIVREMSMSTGVGKDMSSVFQKMQTVVYSGMQMMYLTKGIGGLMTKFSPSPTSVPSSNP